MAQLEASAQSGVQMPQTDAEASATNGRSEETFSCLN